MADVAVVGAGWAGLSAALRAIEAGHRCTLYEAATVPGGRARRVPWDDADGTVTAIDNGQHILLGAYRETLALCGLAGVDPARVLQRHPLHLEGNGVRMVAANLPAPLHLAAAIIGAQGLTWGERLAMLRLMTHLRRAGWRLAPDRSVAALLAEQAQPAGLCRRIWEPLCLAALNTNAATASAQVFVHVLRDSLGGGRHASDLLLPAADLSALLPDAALARVRAHGAVHTGTRVTALAPDAQSVTLTCGTGETARPVRHEAVVLATPPWITARLLAPLPAAMGLAACCAALEYEPIATVWLRFAVAAGASALLSFPMLALADDPARGHYGQWAFDRMRLCGQEGLLAVVISGDGAHRALDAATLAAAVRAQVRDQLGLAAPLIAHRVIVEKRATFRATPELVRPAVRTPWPRLMLAGDYCASDYPATLESAVKSGREAVAALGL